MMLPLPVSPTGGGAFDYRVPDAVDLKPGDFVAVPFGSRRAIGVVWGAAAGNVSPAKLKDILERLECAPLPEVSRRFVDWVARYTVSAPGAVLKMAMSVPDALAPPKPITAYTLNPNPDDFKKTPPRERVLAVLADAPPLIATELAREAATSPGVVKGLIKAGVLQPVSLAPKIAALGVEPDWEKPGPALSVDQEIAAKTLEQATETGGFSVILLDGVPGSGKTEVYFQAVAKALQQGRQVLVLLPEIALSAQWLARFRERFGGDPVE
ncbi:MAG: DEAD/DEAH box helicase family protein, partial [Alphaproteobacteria bacterium]|nr:DEAD/DEAH box helicase family protein [Alphaproteobacteria bacterium]